MQRLIPLAVFATLIVVAPLASAVRADEPEPPRCSLQLVVEVNIDVPNPTDAGFLNSLLGNHIDYSLTLRNVIDDNDVEPEL